ncbi:uridine kinase [Thalassotalea sp. HSM 43]|uniref:uridine kinase n=1 Tax=Thalassotalea sp. HSM 43 TaxID=2552945 RepID=UPI0010804821|nr:uridine kinase [Thalassotalea sp. HSM 43]QBY06269.1 uridine kinase [Thalassotalea sp. HSM 43]
MNNLTIIAVVGASASGKSLFAQTIYDELVEELGQQSMTIIKEDSYYRCQDHLEFEDRTKTNYDHPKAFEHELLAHHLFQLSEGHPIEVPVYNYKEHTRSKEVEVVKPAKVVLVEGILLLTDKQLRQRFDINIFMDTALDICLIRRIKRDLEERGRDLDSVVHQYQTTVRPMYYRFIEPSREHADIVITKGGRNRMALELIKAKVRELAN